MCGDQEEDWESRCPHGVWEHEDGCYQCEIEALKRRISYLEAENATITGILRSERDEKYRLELEHAKLKEQLEAEARADVEIQEILAEVEAQNEQLQDFIRHFKNLIK